MSLLTIQEAAKPASFHQIGRPNQASEPPSLLPPLLRLGFRPFYLLAALFAGLVIPLWVAGYAGLARNPGLGWHIHEMVFGFALAVIIGFLYTAGRNWTGLWTPRGKALGALAAVWLAGRFAMLALPPLPAALVDFAFLPLAAWPLWQVLRRAGNKRNYFLVGLLATLSVLNALYHASSLGWLDADPLHPLRAAILVIVLIESVIGARVIPNFTANALSGVSPVMEPRREKVVTGFVAAAVIGWSLGVPAAASGALCVAAGLALATRIGGYGPQHTLRHPLLWILHLSYAWLAIGMLLLGLSEWGLVPASAAFHALGVGATAGLIIGMLTRTARGHTGRPLRAGRAETVMYLALHAGALLRVLASLSLVDAYMPLLLASAACWSLSFLLYAGIYGPWLCRQRLDGRDG